jgi:glutaminyl-tRNA synthetase
MRRRGYSPEAVRTFTTAVGVSKANSIVEPALLEHFVRDDLNLRSPRVMAVLEPLRVIIENYPDDLVEEFEVPNYPQDKENTETRLVPFSKTIYLEKEDFLENPPGKFFRLAPGREVRLLGAYYITCTEVIKDEAGNVIELRCTYDPESRGGQTPDGRKVKGTLHWVSAAHALPAEIRLYEPLFLEENPEEGSFPANVNPQSLVVLSTGQLEPSLAEAEPGVSYQFMRQGYFTADSEDSTADHLVFNRTISLRDSWAKQQN